MKVGDVVTTKSYGKELQFLVVGDFQDNKSGKNMVILALLDPALILIADEEELVPTTLSDLFASQEDSYLH